MPILEKEPAVYPESLFEGEGQTPHFSDDSVWWAAVTKPRQEKALSRELLAREVPFFLPLIPKENLVRGKIVQSHIPLFTGYLFLCADEQQRVQGLQTNRIVQLLPVVDQQQLWFDLQQVHTLIEVGAPLTVESRLAPGARVRIKVGPMQGLEGVVTARRGRIRMLVAVQFLQTGVSVEVDDFMVEPI